MRWSIKSGRNNNNNNSTNIRPILHIRGIIRLISILKNFGLSETVIHLFCGEMRMLKSWHTNTHKNLFFSADEWSSTITARVKNELKWNEKPQCDFNEFRWHCRVDEKGMTHILSDPNGHWYIKNIQSDSLYIFQFY